jgi:hypothetical protein
VRTGSPEALTQKRSVAQHVAHPRRRVTEELRQGAHRLAGGVDPEAVLVLENLDVELLNDVVGLGERLQAGVLAVQEAMGVAHQGIAGQFQQPTPGFGVGRHGSLQIPLEDGGRFVAHGPRSLLAGRRALRFILAEPRMLVQKKFAPALPLAAVSAGVRNGEARRRPSPPFLNNAFAQAAGAPCVPAPVSVPPLPGGFFHDPFRLSEMPEGLSGCRRASRGDSRLSSVQVPDEISLGGCARSSAWCVARRTPFASARTGARRSPAATPPVRRRCPPGQFPSLLSDLRHVGVSCPQGDSLSSSARSQPSPAS